MINFINKKINFLNMKINILSVLLILVLVFLTSCASVEIDEELTEPTYIAEYKIDEEHTIRIPADEQERGEYCGGICSWYTHDYCYMHCSEGRITERVINSYKKANSLLTTEELIQFCINMYGDREGQLQIYTDVEGRCTICEGELECPLLENEYFLNLETNKIEKK